MADFSTPVLGGCVPIRLDPERVVTPGGHWLPCDRNSPAAARHLLSTALDGQSEDVRELSLLLVSELVTNAVVHAGSDLLLHVDMTASAVKVTVTDFGPGEPDLQPPDAERIGGRGLLFVDALATSWGWKSASGTKSVWFELTVSERAAQPAAA